MEKTQDALQDAEMNGSAISFDNLTILKELGNIANLVREDDFLSTVPQAKLRRVKWVQMFNCLKQCILDDTVQELNSMWEYEQMPEKLEILDKQKEKFPDTNQILWRPQLANVKAQLRAHDTANLQKQKKVLESKAREYEAKVDKLKKTLTAKRGYLKALQLDIQKYQTKNDDFIAKLHEKLENHSNLILPKTVDIDRVEWMDKDMEADMECEREIVHDYLNKFIFQKIVHT